MTAYSEVALFVDFENIRYGMLNQFGTEPDPARLIEKALKYGPVGSATAYADFAQLPGDARHLLERAGISACDVPRHAEVGIGVSSQMAMAMDVVDCMLDRPAVRTLVFVTGDPDFVRLVTKARHRFGKLVVVIGVPGAVSAELIETADLCDPLEGDLGLPATRSGAQPHLPDDVRLLQLVLWLSQNRPYMTFGFIRSHALSPHHGLGFTEDLVTDILSGFKETGILIEGQQEAKDGRLLRILTLDRQHPMVLAVSALEPPHFEESPTMQRSKAA